MPEKGTCIDCSEQDMYDAIGYMLDKAGVTAKLYFSKTKLINVKHH